MGARRFVPLIVPILLLLSACSTTSSPDEMRTQQLSRACTLVNDWPTDYASVWARTVEKAASDGTSPAEAMSTYITARSSFLGDLTDPDAQQIIEDYEAYWGLLERDLNAGDGELPGSGTASFDEILRLMKFCAQFDPELREFLSESDLMNTPPPRADSVETPEQAGRGNSALLAGKWFSNVYGVPCSSPNDEARECVMRTLLETRVIELKPGDYTEVVNVPTLLGDGGTVERYDITQPTNVWCFKSEDFSRTINVFGNEKEVSQSTTYSFDCYFLNDLDRDGDPFAIYMGSLLPDGTIGLTPSDRCRLEFGYGFENLEASSKCREAAEQKTEPDW